MAAEPHARVRREVAATIARAGFDNLTPGDIRVEITGSFERKLGECRYDPDPGEDGPAFVIRVARRLFTEWAGEQWRDTVRHEVAHAHVKARYGSTVAPHGRVWQAAARRAGANPTARYEGPDESLDPNYVLACPDGCHESPYLKRSKRVKYPWRYSCRDCGAQLVSYDAGVRPANLDPGMCYVASIPWTTREETASSPARGRYVLACPNDCASWPYQQRSKRIKYPWRYACQECSARLVSYDHGSPPPDPEPGTCYVRSIQWETPRYAHACPNGCFATGYVHQSAQITDPGRYRCGDCGAATISHPAGQSPEEPTPGTRYPDG